MDLAAARGDAGPGAQARERARWEAVLAPLVAAAGPAIVVTDSQVKWVGVGGFRGWARPSGWCLPVAVLGQHSLASAPPATPVPPHPLIKTF